MPSFSAKPAIRQIVFVVYDGVKLLDVSGPLQVFTEVNEGESRPPYDLKVASLNGGRIATDAGISIDTIALNSISVHGEATLVACGGDGVYEAARNCSLVAEFRETAARCARVASTCTGAFLLAAADILDGRRAVTHWKRCHQLAVAAPSAIVEPDPIYIEDAGVWTSAGVTAGIDLALALVEADLGREVALAIAREMLVYVKRPGGQSQFSEALRHQTRSVPKFDHLHLWMREHVSGDLRVEALARHCGMSPRNFARAYLKSTGTTPAQAVESLRIELAREMLERSDRNIKSIAVTSGFGNAERMRRAFTRVLGVAPQDYRLRFAGSHS